MSRLVRLLIYARGDPDEIREQHAECYELVRLVSGHEVVSVASDPPGSTAGWQSANAMLEAGEVDRIICASRDVVPDLDAIESITQEIRVPHQPSRAAEPARHRRTRPMRRRWGGEA